jgi:hypothetical protein
MATSIDSIDVFTSIYGNITNITMENHHFHGKIHGNITRISMGEIHPLSHWVTSLRFRTVCGGMLLQVQVFCLHCDDLEVVGMVGMISLG